MRHQFRNKFRDIFAPPLDVTILDQNVFSLNVTKFSETTLERLDPRTRICLISRRCYETDARNFRWLLSLGHSPSHHEHASDYREPQPF